MYRCDRKERIGGGEAIWVKDSIVSGERGDIKEGINVEDWRKEEWRNLIGRKSRKEEYMNNSKGHVVREEY